MVKASRKLTDPQGLLKFRPINWRTHATLPEELAHLWGYMDGEEVHCGMQKAMSCEQFFFPIVYSLCIIERSFSLPHPTI